MAVRKFPGLKSVLLAATLLSGSTLGTAWAATGNGDADNSGQAPLPTGQFITPSFATGAVFSPLNPDFPEYTAAIGNYPNFKPDGAIASTLSPDGKTLAVMTSGYNVLDDANARLLGTGAEFIVLYDVTNPAKPTKIQTLRPPNTFVGLAFSANGSTIYVSGGADDQVLIYTRQGTQFAQSAVVSLGHADGIGAGQAPQASGLSLSLDGSLLAIANSLNNSVTVLRTADNTKLLEYDLRPFNTTPATGNGVAGGETLYSVAFRGNDTLYTTSLRDREVVVISLASGTASLVTRIALPGNPNNLVLNKAQDTLYVSQDNADVVAVIDTASNTVREEIDAIAPPGIIPSGNDRYTGAATNNLTLSPDQNTLYVTNGGANALAVIPLAGAAPHRVAGLIPTGWYPTTVTASADGSTLYIFNNKSDPGANPGKHSSSLPHLSTETYVGGNNFANEYSANQYVLQLDQSGMLTVPVPRAADLPVLTTQVAANNGWSVPVNTQDALTMSFLRNHIQHVIYIVKENRTFDQVLGDLNNGANGDPSLTIFGKRITPNFHRMSSAFVTLDNFFDAGEVSGNGWPWSTAARETDWNEKNIPMNYTFGVNRGNAPYDAEGQNNNVSVGYVGADPAGTVAARAAEAGGYNYADTTTYSNSGAALPGGAVNVLPGLNDTGAPDGKNGANQAGYIWDAALRAGLTVRNYGFFSDNSHYGLKPTDPGYVAPLEFPYAAAQSGTPGARQMWTAAHSLINLTDPYFRGFDNAYPDWWRYEEFSREFQGFVAGNNLPNVVLLRYMHDHMGNFSATSLGGASATAEVEQADNDYAVGRTLQLLANSPYAANTLVFVIEDDAQDGGDHMDAHRSTAYVVGPYVRNGAIVGTRYSTVNMIRTMEDVLGTEHLNLNTAYQRPMSDVFDITKSPAWSYAAVASPFLRNTSLTLSSAEPDANVQFADGETATPMRSAAWWARHTRGFDFSSEDRVPADLFNQVVWQGMMGDSPYPTVRSGLFMGRPQTNAVPLNSK